MNQAQYSKELNGLIKTAAEALQSALVKIKTKKPKPPSYMRMFAKKHLNEKLTFKAD